MGVLFIVQLIISVLLIGAILLQVGKGASTGAVFGGKQDTFFGPSGEASFLGKLIIILTVLFMVNTVSLYMYSRQAPPPIAPPAPENTR